MAPSGRAAATGSADDQQDGHLIVCPLTLCPLKLVGLGRLERPTSPLSGVRSNHLSYRPVTCEGRPRTQRPAAERRFARLPAVVSIACRRKRNEDGEISPKFDDQA